VDIINKINKLDHSSLAKLASSSVSSHRNVETILFSVLLPPDPLVSVGFFFIFIGKTFADDCPGDHTTKSVGNEVFIDALWRDILIRGEA